MVLTTKWGLTMLKFIRRLGKNTSGATAIEYGLIAALVSVAAIGALGAMGTSLDTMLTKVSTELNTATTGAGTTPPPTTP
jgi:pilus assembly protein Flp/PilA